MSNRLEIIDAVKSFGGAFALSEAALTAESRKNLLENGKIVLRGGAANLGENADIEAFHPGISEAGRASAFAT